MSILTSPRLRVPADKRLILPARTWSALSGTGPDGSISKNILQIPGIREHFLPVGGGGAQGYNEAADIVENLVDGTGTNDLWAAYQAAVRLRNTERQALVDFLTYRQASPIEKIASGTSGARFERASEYGIPRGHRPAGEYDYMGFDFSWFDLGNRFTWEFLIDATTEQVNAVADQALEADSILMFQMVMWTLFNNVNRDIDVKQRPYKVYTFWNGTDGEIPPDYKNNTFLSTHTHYLSSGAATVDSGDLDDMQNHLTHHGYSKSEGYNLILMVNTEQGDTIRNFRSIANGGTAKYDFIPATGTPSFLLPTDLRVAEGQVQPAATIRGMDVIGSYGQFTIVQEDYIPAKYMVAFATGGRDSVQNPIGIREHANQTLRGLRLVKGRDADYPLQEAYYQRGFGTGIRHRGAGLVMQVTAGAYTIPATYAVQP